MARLALYRGQDYDTAESYVHQALLANLYSTLTAVTHIQIELRRNLPTPSVRSLAEIYHKRWPECLHFILVLADTMMEMGENNQAVSLLHQAVSLDVTGEVASRLWGPDHVYQRLWPKDLEAPVLQDLPLPASISAALGWNRLPAGSTHPEQSKQSNIDPLPSGLTGVLGGLVGQSRPVKPFESPNNNSHGNPLPNWKTDENQVRPAIQARAAFSVLPEYLRNIQVEMERIADRLRQPQIARSDGRFPVYILFTTRQGLQSQFGEASALLIEEAMERTSEAIRLRGDWGSLLFYADEGFASPSSSALASLREKPARANDAWSLKLILADLDACLGRQGEMIGAVLIVGGPEVVPFHRLPNPVDDADVDIPSDNPYTTRDENYFIPEWSVGRLPGGKGDDPSFLIKGLQTIAEVHQQASVPRPWYVRWWRSLSEWSDHGRFGKRKSLGYTAAIWKRAASSVFRPIGEERSMLVSPPIQVSNGTLNQDGVNQAESENQVAASQDRNNNQVELRLYPARLAYFNLHGLEDAIQWYGHRDPSDPCDGPDYPVALRPEDVESQLNHGRSPAVIFSEACYGAHIQDRSVNESMALTFLASGSQAVVGSTCTAYGAVAGTLTAADLLGRTFWDYVNQGFPAGEALRRAKIHLAREMHRRQGYLDGEDQKTLIAFTLYGDPLALANSYSGSRKGVLRALSSPSQVKTVCDRQDDIQPSEPIDPEVLLHLKQIVKQYLPGLVDARLTISQERALCNGRTHQCPTAQMGSASQPRQAPARRVVTLTKQVMKATTVHKHYARLTLDAEGRLVKLVVSR
jgi:hypothetical protein